MYVIIYNKIWKTSDMNSNWNSTKMQNEFKYIYVKYANYCKYKLTSILFPDFKFVMFHL